MVNYFRTEKDVDQLLNKNAKASIVVILVARYSDIYDMYDKIEMGIDSIKDLTGNSVILGLPIEVKWHKNKKSNIRNDKSANITEIKTKLKIRESSVPCLYLYDVVDKSHKIITIDRNMDLYELIKNIITVRDSYIIGEKEKTAKKISKKRVASNAELVVSNLKIRKSGIVAFFSKLDNIIKLITLVTSLCAALNLISNQIYKLNCQGFYNIPLKYFSVDIDEKIIVIFYTSILLSTMFFPYIEKKYLIRDGAKKATVIVGALFTAIFASLVICCLNIINLSIIIDKMERNSTNYNKNFIFNNMNYIIITILILGVIGVIGIVFFDNICNIKNKVWGIIVAIVATMGIIVNFGLSFYSVFSQLTLDISDKSRYEMITNGCNEYIVLSYYNDKALVVNFKIDDGEYYTFYTSQYNFIDRYDGTYKCISLKHKPIIE